MLCLQATLDQLPLPVLFLFAPGVTLAIVDDVRTSGASWALLADLSNAAWPIIFVYMGGISIVVMLFLNRERFSRFAAGVLNHVWRRPLHVKPSDVLRLDLPCEFASGPSKD